MSNLSLYDGPVLRAPTQADGFHRCLIEGLSKSPKALPCKYFYDATGSDLFDRICELPEYYQTRTELALLKAHAAEMALLAGSDVQLIEFGAGSLKKVRVLLDHFNGIEEYVPIDISGDYLRAVANELDAEYGGFAVTPVIGDFTANLPLPESGARRVGFFPGSTIGNFRHDEARSLLANAADMLRGGGLLIGADLVKDPHRLHAAYNDAAGVTALFNKNVLARANRDLGANFDLETFVHYAPYNPMAQRIEMYLVSLKKQRVRVLGRSFDFEEGEAIHTEDSHKYTIHSFRTLAREAGFEPTAVWTDPDNLFSLHWLEAR
jgi:dimethylhistidine N-methyltransferase